MLPKSVAAKRTKTPEQALASLMRLCARAEKSENDARRLMHNWGIGSSDADRIIERLAGDRFIDDVRYAEAYVREKLRLSGWGTYKIRAALQRKSIDRQIIDRALAQADDTEMEQRLAEQLAHKQRTIRYSSAYDLRNKLIRYGMSIGYDYAQVIEAVQNRVKVDDDEEHFE